VVWISTAPSSSPPKKSQANGEASAAAARGSFSVDGSVSLVTSSDWTTTCTSASSGSTS
jgi:hypothetical protein